MGNPFLDRLKNAGKNSHGKTSEKRIAKKMGARLHPNSGAMQGAKSDASLGDYRLEMKSTLTDTLKLEIGWLAKISKEALSHGQVPGVVVSFVNADGTPRLRHHTEWVLIPRESFKELVDKG